MKFSKFTISSRVLKDISLQNSQNFKIHSTHMQLRNCQTNMYIFNHVVRKRCLWLKLFLPVLRLQSKALCLLADKNQLNSGDLTGPKQSLVFQIHTIKIMRATTSPWFYHMSS